MSRTTAILLSALGLSVLVNALTLARLSSSKRPVEAVRAPAAPDPRVDRLVGEIEQLRRDIAARPSVGAPSPAAPGAPAPVAPAPTPASPRLAEALAEQDSFDAFWASLKQIARAHESLEPAEYRAHAFDATAGYLGVDHASFAAAAAQMLAELEAVEKAHNAEWRQVWAMRERPEFEARAKEVADRRDAARAAAEAKLRALLAPDAVKSHKRFLAKLMDWESVIRSPEFAAEMDE
jgi:hypothetical protein